MYPPLFIFFLPLWLFVWQFMLSSRPINMRNFFLQSNPSVPCCALGLCKSLQQYLASLKSVQITTNEIPDVDLSKIVPPFMANLPKLPILFKPQEKTDLTPKVKYKYSQSRTLLCHLTYKYFWLYVCVGPVGTNARSNVDS